MTLDRKALDSAMARAASEMDSIEAGRAINAGPCSACRYSFCKDPICRFESDFVCSNPLVSPMRYDPSGDDVEQHYETQRSARSRSGLCGPAGALFSRRPIWMRWYVWLAVGAIAYVAFLRWLFS